jgi:hypothetical protein
VPRKLEIPNQAHPFDRGVETRNNARVLGLVTPGLGKAFGCFGDELGVERLALYRMLDEHLRPQLPALGEPGGGEGRDPADQRAAQRGRCGVLSWRLSNTLTAGFCVEALVALLDLFPGVP